MSKLKMSDCGLSKEEFEKRVKPMPADYYTWLNGANPSAGVAEPSEQDCATEITTARGEVVRPA